MNSQPKNTLEKVYDEVEKLHDAEEALSTLLKPAGRDSETTYTVRYTILLKDLKILYRDVQSVLNKHLETVIELESAIDATPKEFDPHSMEGVAIAAGLISQ